MDIDETRYYRESDGNLLKLDIIRESDPMNPRTEWDNVATMVCFHRKYTLGDVKTLPEGKTDVIPHTNVRYDNSYDGAEAFADWARAELKCGNLVIASLELYDHSGITMKVHDWGDAAFGTGRTGWDSGIVGWCFITKEQADKELAVNDEDIWQEKAKNAIESEVEIYDDYLRGDVYGYKLSRLSSYKIIENGEEKLRFSSDAEWEYVDNCWGYYGCDHDESGLTECIMNEAVLITEDDLPRVAKEAA